MAKGNMFQGMARGKVGDVVFYRMNGIQMSRVRNRTPKNPRTNEQLYQRSIIASVMKLYSAGKEIFDHSFQGYTIGEGCMRRFNSVNARILRSQVIDDIALDRSDAQNIGHVVNPKSLTFTPIIDAQISEGTLEQTLFKITKIGSGNTHNVTFNFAGIDNTEESNTVEQLFDKLGIYAGDIFTICLCGLDTSNVLYLQPGNNSDYNTMYASTFEWIRFTVKSIDFSKVTLVNLTWANIFDIESSGPNINLDGKDLIVDFTITGLLNEYDIATFGIIRSREDEPLRSTSYMVKAQGAPDWGVISKYIIPVWAQDVQKIGQSELILEGGDEAGVTTAGLSNIDNTPIIPAPVSESIERMPGRHKGTHNEKKG